VVRCNHHRLAASECRRHWEPRQGAAVSELATPDRWDLVCSAARWTRQGTESIPGGFGSAKHYPFQAIRWVAPPDQSCRLA
jgi:hypothetical protein